MRSDLLRVFLTEKGARRAAAGHPWVFEGEVTRILDGGGEEAAPEDGGLVNVFSPKERFLGAGYYNSASKIRVRILSTNANDTFDGDFYRRRVRYALDYRRAVMGEDLSACRLIHGEADQFPGLTVDRFGDLLVAQTLCLGTERVKNVIFEALCEELAADGVAVRGIYERNDVPIRTLEGMECGRGFWRPEDFPGRPEDGHVLIRENGLAFDVDFMNGQKTGFFLDQKYNRRAAANLAKGRRVLDCFTHTGAFALCCAAAGARHVTAVDVSASALEEAKRNAALNGLSDRIDFVQADVFELLTDMVQKKERGYDMIILDPPAFTKSSATAKDAYRGYKDINYRAMRILPRGGFLATCSCSHFMTDEWFRRMMDEAAHDAGVALRQIEARAQAPDHPVLRTVPETGYLKFYLEQVV